MTGLITTFGLITKVQPMNRQPCSCQDDTVSPTLLGPVGASSGWQGAGGATQCNEREWKGWAGLTGASRGETDNRGAWGLWLKPEALSWHFKRPEWLCSHLSINRCTQSRKKQARKDADVDGQKNTYILTDSLRHIDGQIFSLTFEFSS